MISVRFKVTCHPEKSDLLRAGFEEFINPSRNLDGVVSFDIGLDLLYPNVFIATEVFEDLDALKRQEMLPAVQEVVQFLPEALASEPEATIFHVSSSEPWEG